MKRLAIGLAALYAVGFSGAVWAQGMDITAKFTDTAVIIETKGPYTNMTLSVSGPNKFYTEVFSGDKPPAVDLRKVDEFDDGAYRYHVSAATKEIVPVRTALDDGRESITKQLRKGVSANGTFFVKGGVIVKFEDIPEEK